MASTTINPDKYIRAAYINALSVATGLPVWHKVVPKTVTPIPSQYIILDNQTKNETVQAKQTGGENDQKYFEWLTTMDVNIYNVQPVGYSNAAELDDIEQTVINIVRMGKVSIQGFSNKNTAILETQDLSADTTTQSVGRKLIKFEHWLDRPITLDPTSVQVDYGYFDVDYFSDPSSAPFQFTKYAVNGLTSLTIPYPLAASGKFLGFRIESGQKVFDSFYINMTNQGAIPSFRWHEMVQIGGYDYYFTRSAIVLDQEVNEILFE